MSADFSFQNDTFFIAGVWDRSSVAGLDFKGFLRQGRGVSGELVFDFRALKFIDMAGVVFFLALQNDLALGSVKSKRINLPANFQKLFELCEKHYQRTQKEIPKRLSFFEFFEKFGALGFEFLKILKRFINFSGFFFLTLFFTLKRPQTFRFVSFLYHIENSALKALPIIILTALLVGVVLAYQAAFQLAQFGANIFIVDLVGISATRELAPLIAAIVIAGRSASAYTAQIGVMKLTDEIAAMNTMGFSTFNFIIIPRVLALMVAMPLIVAVSDFVSILGGMIVAQVSLDINFAEFIRRFKEAVELKHILIGLAKAPVFGFLIAMIACFRGLEVKNTTQSIGTYTTKSVVNAIFWVIAFDALFSVILTQAGL